MLIYLQMLESPEEKSILEQIYLEYRGLMYHVAYEILHNEQDAEDAVHHAFVKIAENIKKITDPVCPKTHSYVVMEMSRNVQSENTQNLKSMVIQRSFPKRSVAERRKTVAASDQAAVCACAHSRYFTGGSPSGLRV